MWRKPEDSKPNSSLGASSSAGSPVRHPGAGAEQNSPNAPAVSKDIKIKGEISGQGDLCIDGELEGKVCLTGGTFTVGPNAHVSAEIEAREVVIRGEVVGALRSCQRVHILSTGKLTGDMETRGIIIEDGAVLHSKVAVPKADTPQSSGSESLQRAKGAASA